MKKMELEKSQGGRLISAIVFQDAYMPAKARGLVKSSTRCPASSPSPSTEMTIKSSEEMVAVVWEKPEEYLRCEGTDAKTS